MGEEYFSGFAPPMSRLFESRLVSGQPASSARSDRFQRQKLGDGLSTPDETHFVPVHEHLGRVRP